MTTISRYKDVRTSGGKILKIPESKSESTHYDTYQMLTHAQKMIQALRRADHETSRTLRIVAWDNLSAAAYQIDEHIAGLKYKKWNK